MLQLLHAHNDRDLISHLQVEKGPFPQPIGSSVSLLSIILRGKALENVRSFKCTLSSSAPNVRLLCVPRRSPPPFPSQNFLLSLSRSPEILIYMNHLISLKALRVSFRQNFRINFFRGENWIDTKKIFRLTLSNQQNCDSRRPGIRRVCVGV